MVPRLCRSQALNIGNLLLIPEDDMPTLFGLMNTAQIKDLKDIVLKNLSQLSSNNKSRWLRLCIVN
jgi:hypothetical protein